MPGKMTSADGPMGRMFGKSAKHVHAIPSIAMAPEVMAPMAGPKITSLSQYSDAERNDFLRIGLSHLATMVPKNTAIIIMATDGSVLAMASNIKDEADMIAIMRQTIRDMEERGQTDG